MSVAENINQFGFELLEQILNKTDFSPDTMPKKNLFISPISVALSLSMLIEGADGETKSQLLNMLHFSENYLVELKATVNSLLNIMQVSNSIWVQHTLKLTEAYDNIIKQNFTNSDAINVDFTDPQTKDKINAWIEQKTAGLIRDALDPAKDTALLLVNALFFKGEWLKSFDRGYSQRLPFKGFGFNYTPEYMISMHDKFSFHNGSNFKALELPYSYLDQSTNKPATSMFIVLPKPPVVPNWAKICNGEFLSTFVKQIVPEMVKNTTEVEVYLPKFGYADEYSLKAYLELLGAKDMWNPGSANFSKMITSSGNLFASSAIHKTYIEVDEVGTKAAAVSAISMGYGAAGEDPEEFKAEHPFIYLIYHHTTKQVLFVGYVLKPMKPVA